MKNKIVIVIALAAGIACGPAMADKLDDIISSGKLRCGVTLDFPPMGMRDDQNNPIGFDVDYCNDLATALGVTVEIVDTPFPEHIPALMSGRIDVGVASTSDTLERAKTIGFTIPYFAFDESVVANETFGITSSDDLKGKTIGATAGSYEAVKLKEVVDAWGEGELRTYQSQADVYLALSQGQIAATVAATAEAQSNIKSGKFPGLVLVGKSPLDTGYVSLFAARQEYGLINYLNLFVHLQVRNGRCAELYEKWVGGDLPDLTIPGVYR